MAPPRTNQNPEHDSTRRDAIARQTSAWLFTLSEDENRVIAEIVNRVRRAVPQYGHLDIRADKRDWQREAGAEVLDFLFYVGAEWLKGHLARVDAIDSCQGGGTVDAAAIVAAEGRPLFAGSSPAPDTSAAGRHGARRDDATPLDPGHETPTGGDFCGLADRATVTLYMGDRLWHDGPGWYYVIDEYPDEGSCGAFNSRIEAIEHARASGYEVENAAGSGFVELANLIESETTAAQAHHDAKEAAVDKYGYGKEPGLNSATLWSADMGPDGRVVDEKFDDSEGGE